jgi:hypothetical protein
MRWRLVLVAAVAGLLVAQAASASSSAARVKLSLVVLPPAALGAGNSTLPIGWFDSGTVSNNQAAFNAPAFIEPKRLKRLGRVTGYLLDYGNPYSGGPGVTQIRSEADRYRTPTEARRALSFWRGIDAKAAQQDLQVGIHVTFHKVKEPALGSGHFAVLTALSIPGADAVYIVDEQVSEAGYVLDTTVAAGTTTLAEQLAGRLAAKLDRRLRLARKGHLKASPVPLPGFPEPGPPPGGPDLSTLVLGPSDFTPSTLISQGYSIDLQAVSDYSVEIRPAAHWDDFLQDAEWFANANEATWPATIEADGFAALAQLGDPFRGVDVSSAGDHAQAVVAPGISQSGADDWWVFVVFWNGQASSTILAQSTAAPQDSDVQALAQAAVTRFEAGLGG